MSGTAIVTFAPTVISGFTGAALVGNANYVKSNLQYNILTFAAQFLVSIPSGTGTFNGSFAFNCPVPLTGNKFTATNQAVGVAHIWHDQLGQNPSWSLRGYAVAIPNTPGIIIHLPNVPKLVTGGTAYVNLLLDMIIF